MSQPSYKLSKGAGGSWFAEGVLPSGRPFKVDCGKGSRDRADGVAEMKLRAKMASSKGSRDRWNRFKAERAAAGARADNGEATASPAKSPASAPASAADAPRTNTPARDPAEIRAKLLALGDSSSSSSSSSSSEPAPEVLPPGARRDEDEDEELDEEGGELIAGLLAKGATLAIVALANAPLKKRRPPMRGEPHEKGLEYFHDGMEVQLKKLVGKTATLGPTGKIFAGAAIIFASVYMTAEPIPGATAEETKAPPAAPAPAPAASSSSSNGVHDQAEETALAVQGSPLGEFGSH